MYVILDGLVMKTALAMHLLEFLRMDEQSTVKMVNATASMDKLEVCVYMLLHVEITAVEADFVFKDHVNVSLIGKMRQTVHARLLFEHA